MVRAHLNMDEERCTLRVNRLMRPGSLKKMLFLTRSPLTWECSMVTRHARGAVPLETHKRTLVLRCTRPQKSSPPPHQFESLCRPVCTIDLISTYSHKSTNIKQLRCFGEKYLLNDQIVNGNGTWVRRIGWMSQGINNGHQIPVDTITGTTKRNYIYHPLRMN